MIEHIKNDDQLLHDLSSLLKPGGRLSLSTPSKAHRPMVGEYISEQHDGGHVRFGYSHDEIGSLLARHQLEVVQEAYVTGFVSQQIDNLMRVLFSLCRGDSTFG